MRCSIMLCPFMAAGFQSPVCSMTVPAAPSLISLHPASQIEELASEPTSQSSTGRTFRHSETSVFTRREAAAAERASTRSDADRNGKRSEALRNQCMQFRGPMMMRMPQSVLSLYDLYSALFRLSAIRTRLRRRKRRGYGYDCHGYLEVRRALLPVRNRRRGRGRGR
jgi:hypothetical protein